jgi:hypothetical protein
LARIVFRLVSQGQAERHQTRAFSDAPATSAYAVERSFWERKMMGRTAFVSALLAAMTLSTSSLAQSWGDYGGLCNEGRAHALEARVARDVRDGRVNWREARDLHGKIDWVEGLEARACRYGPNDWQARDIDQHYERIAVQIRNAENGYPQDDNY